MSETTGSCLCGKVQYRYEGAPVMTGVCHCRDCQKQTGTSFSIIQGVPMAAINVTGTPKVFATQGMSGGAVVVVAGPGVCRTSPKPHCKKTPRLSPAQTSHHVLRAPRAARPAE